MLDDIICFHGLSMVDAVWKPHLIQGGTVYNFLSAGANSTPYYRGLPYTNRVSSWTFFSPLHRRLLLRPWRKQEIAKLKHYVRKKVCFSWQGQLPLPHSRHAPCFLWMALKMAMPDSNLTLFIRRVASYPHVRTCIL